MVELQLDFDNTRLLAAMERYRKEFGKDEENVVKFAAGQIARSLGGATRKSKKLRKVVKNPDERALTDRRRAFWGVWKFRGDRSQRFVPIYKTGEFGLIRFDSKKTGEQLTRNPVTGKVRRAQFDLREFENAGGVGLMNNPKRKIGRSGLAKKTWSGIARRVRSGGTVSPMDVSRAGTVKHEPLFGGFQILLSNHLKYARDAMNEGMIRSVTEKAGNSMQGAMNARVKAKLKRAGLT
jgi:hypothetical protein